MLKNSDNNQLTILISKFHCSSGVLLARGNRVLRCNFLHLKQAEASKRLISFDISYSCKVNGKRGLYCFRAKEE